MADTENLYDEFGNYIGEDLDEIEDEDQQQQVDDQQQQQQEDTHTNGHEDQPTIEEDVEMQPISTSSAIVLHEDKKYFPDAEEVFKGAEVMVQDEDTQPLTQPIINPKKHKEFTIVEKSYPPTTYPKQFLLDLLRFPQLSRNVCLLGSLHHGKTTFMDMLFLQTHEKKWQSSKPIKYTDTRKDEQEREISIKSTPMSLVLQNSNDKSYLINILDTPGHPNFLDEVTASIRLCDGAVIVVDALEGVMMQTERLIKHAVSEGLEICVVINKIDRLILELKLPPVDAYFKIKHTIDEINVILDIYSHTDSSSSTTGSYKVSPELGNVLFASSEMGWCFTLQSFAKIYSESFGGGFNVGEFAKRLWGDLYYDTNTRGFKRKPPTEDSVRSFVHFILNPLYKIISTVMTQEKSTTIAVLGSLGIQLSKETYDLDIRPLLRIVLSNFFGKANAFVDMLVALPSPVSAAQKKIESTYTGPLNGEYGKALLACDPQGPLMISVTKLLSKSDGSGFECLGRVLSGTLKKGQEVRVLGEKYSPDNDEDMAVEQVAGVYIGEARYKIEIETAYPGNWVLIDGIDPSIVKTATITDAQDVDPNHDHDRAHTFKPLMFITKSVCKVAIEPLNPSELPKMLDGLRKVNKSYPLLVTKAEESGEHVILGTGELYLDCVLHDLRFMYTEIEIKVDDPVISLAETIVETSSIKCHADTQNKKNRLSMIAEPLEKGLSHDIENGSIKIDWPKKKRSDFLQHEYNWDILAANSLWAFGPDSNGPNVLLNDVLPDQVNKSLLIGVSDSIIRGFQWATKEGPLVDEPIRNVKFKLLGATIAPEAIQRSSGHIVPAARSVTHSSFLVATPRLMEPVFVVEVVSPIECLSAIETILTRRRGHIVQDSPKPGTPLHITKALLPVLDSYGFETDLRSQTQGQAFCLCTFDHWQVVPGDPLDKTIKLRTLEPSPQPHLARELLIKTRRRKGLSEDVNFSKHFDDDLLLSLASQNENQYR
ncbi:hypothetical protein CYY_007808 [Polysphondylium violaceum]|uniref:116 kDa U5 small nuclear ribonucleoprotein component n=1 Tax=Polysphondylium violaceum TaxID=133409 RepID=A0A8J4PN36_9MYCE|nr:hypothetical protein CYY_007808 [Polysphondylium violaceum]